MILLMVIWFVASVIAVVAFIHSYQKPALLKPKKTVRHQIVEDSFNRDQFVRMGNKLEFMNKRIEQLHHVFDAIEGLNKNVDTLHEHADLIMYSLVDISGRLDHTEKLKDYILMNDMNDMNDMMMI